jgi:putative heme-binding domain-containing protein
MVSSPGLAASLVEAVETASVPVAEIDPASRSLLLKQGDLALQARVAKLLSTSMPANRAEVLKRYEPALELSGVVTRGQALFEKNCISCHAHRGTGAKVGPDLAGVAGKLPEELLVSILDPARDASPDGIGVVVLTNDGRTLSGILAEENAEMVRLRQAEGREENIPRADVELVRSTGKSLMPEGLEAVLKPQDLADLIAFLRDVSAAHK